MAGDVLLIRLAARREEFLGIAGQRLKFHIAGAAAKAGAVGLAIGGLPAQAGEIRGQLTVKFHAVGFQLGGIPEGFIHDIKDIRLLWLP